MFSFHARALCPALDSAGSAPGTWAEGSAGWRALLLLPLGGNEAALGLGAALQRVDRDIASVPVVLVGVRIHLPSCKEGTRASALHMQQKHHRRSSEGCFLKRKSIKSKGYKRVIELLVL